MALFFLTLPWIASQTGAGGYGELGLRLHQGWSSNLLVGFAVGCLLPLALFLVLRLTGHLQPAGLIPWPRLLLQGLIIFGNTCYIGFWEELLCRGYLLRVLPDRLSPAVTLLAVGLVFSLFHIPRWGAPAPWWAFWFVSGIMFALPFLATGSLWLSAGVHWGFDFLWFALLATDGLLRYDQAGTAALNSGAIPLLSVLLFLPVVWWVGEQMVRA